MWEKSGFAKANSILFDETDDKSNDSNNGKNEKQNFCNFNRTGSNSAEAKYCGNKCNYQKNYGIVQQEQLLECENIR